MLESDNEHILDEFEQAVDLVKDLQPTQPTEYILKGVVNAIYGQEHKSVS